MASNQRCLNILLKITKGPHEIKENVEVKTELSHPKILTGNICIIKWIRHLVYTNRMKNS